MSLFRLCINETATATPETKVKRTLRYIEGVKTNKMNTRIRISSAKSCDYRYAFQAQEKDDEIKGKGNSYNYTYRMHDTRLGRFFAVDPLSAKYPWNSPYAFSENVVINAVELEGLEKVEVYNWAYSSATKKNEMTYSHTYTDKSLVGDYNRVDDYDGHGNIEKQVWKDKQWKNTSVITEDDIAYALRNNKPKIPINREVHSPYVSAFEYSNPIAQEMFDVVVPDAVGVTVGTGAHAGPGGTTNVGFVLFTSGPNAGFHGIHVKTAGLGLEANLSFNIFAGYYNGNKNNMKKDFGGIGYQVSGDVILGGGTWTSLKDDYTPGWSGISLGLGLSGGSSAEVTKTEYLEKKTDAND